MIQGWRLKLQISAGRFDSFRGRFQEGFSTVWQIELYQDEQWCPVGFFTLAGMAVWRWEYPADARWWLGQLFADVPDSLKRVVRV